jgi:hypothetical protein
MPTTQTAGNAGDAIIVGAEIGAGHDGDAVLIVSLRFGNGRCSRVTLDTDAGQRLMRNCRASDTSQLQGHSWRTILDNLECST